MCVKVLHKVETEYRCTNNQWCALIKTLHTPKPTNILNTRWKPTIVSAPFHSHYYRLTVDHVIRWLYSGFSTIFHTLEMKVVTVWGSVSSSCARETAEVREAISIGLAPAWNTQRGSLKTQPKRSEKDELFGTFAALNVKPKQPHVYRSVHYKRLRGISGY